MECSYFDYDRDFLKTLSVYFVFVILKMNRSNKVCELAELISDFNVTFSF